MLSAHQNSPLEGRGGRDLRLDLFRGLALLTISIDHTHHLWLAHATIGKFMFFDASEMFVFIAGYTAALVYGRVLRQQGLAAAVARIYRRIWKIYLAQLGLFAVLLLFHSAWVWAGGQPGLHIAGLTLSALKLQGPFSLMYTLPVYMALLAVLPALLLLLHRRPLALLGLSAALYVAELVFRWDPAAVGLETTWVNILNWQFLFIIGLCARRALGSGVWRQRQPGWLPGLAIAAVLLFALAHAVLADWSMLAAHRVDWLWDKHHLGLLRLVNFLLAAYVVAHWLRHDSPLLRWPALRPLRLCGQHSLPTFCLGAVLSAVGGAVLARFGDGALPNIVIPLGSIALLFSAAWFLQRNPLSFAVALKGQRRRPSPVGSIGA